MKKIFKTLTIIVLILSGLQSVEAQNKKGFTLDEAKEYHRKFQYPMNEWFGKGDFTRYVYLNMPEFWFHTSLQRNASNPVLELPNKPNEQLAEHLVNHTGNQYPLQEYVLKNPIDGLIILNKGVIVFEEYPQMLPYQRHIWFSISKTLVSASVALLEDHGKIDVKLPVSAYLPELKETDWETIPVIDLLDMASGIEIKDDYADANGPFMTFYNQLGFPRIDQSIDNP
ncbi:MAG: serine hydrolase, partial [Maribacter sp.]